MAGKNPNNRSPDDRKAALKPTDFYILSVLARGDRHGYGLVTEIEDLSEGRIALAPGSLYAVLRRLRGWGWIDEIDGARGSESGGPPRRLFRLSGEGRKALVGEVERMRQAVARYDAEGHDDRDRRVGGAAPDPISETGASG